MSFDIDNTDNLIMEGCSDNLYCYSTENKDINSLGFRSDEFKKEHNGKHILFSGCSNTYGSGLLKNEIWANKVYNYISKDQQCSGFFNLGVPGSGINHICFNLFRYFKLYGNPEIIFLNLTNHGRFFLYDKSKELYKLKVEDSQDFNILKLLHFQYYFMLEEYCKSNNIQLFSFTWDYFGGYTLIDSILKEKRKNKNFENSTNELFKKYNFKTFYKIDFDQMIDEVANLKLKYNSKYFIVARDNIHQGTGVQHWWANFIYKKYLEKQGNINI